LPNRPGSVVRIVAKALFIYGLWFTAGLFFASQHALISWTRGFESPVTYLYSMLLGTSIWALFTPPVIFVAERLPLEPPNLFRNALLLLPFAVVVAALRSPMDVFIPWYAYGSYSVADPASRFLALFHIHFLFVLIVIALTQVARIERHAAEKRDAEERFALSLAQTRLRRLRADLNPHFLFNALNAAASLLETNPAAAERTLDTLSDLLSRSVASENALEVRLADELEFVERYLDVQKTRFGSRLRTEIGVSSPELFEAAIPPLLIQPLVENAIVHSVGKRAEGGWIGVRVRSSGAKLYVEVQDDGDGFDPAALGGGSIGVPNARARLQYLYGANQSLSFEHRNGRFVATVQLPLRRLEPAA
jgi:two-component system LytT family sensor kinase